MHDAMEDEPEEPNKLGIDPIRYLLRQREAERAYYEGDMERANYLMDWLERQ